MDKLKPVCFLRIWGILILIHLQDLWGFFLTRGPNSDLTLILHQLNILASRGINPDLHKHERSIETNYFTPSIDRDSTKCDKPTKGKYFKNIFQNNIHDF